MLQDSSDVFPAPVQNLEADSAVNDSLGHAHAAKQSSTQQFSDKQQSSSQQSSVLQPVVSPSTQWQEGWFEGVGSVKLYYQTWLPSRRDPPRASIVMMHGLGSHSGLFLPLVQHLLAQNYGVYTFDLRGHGRSEGQRAYINHWSEFRDDLRQFLHLVARQARHRSCILMGHSLGAAIALDYALRFPDTIQGLMLTAPALSSQGISPLKMQVGRLLSLVWPRFSLNTGLKRQPPSRDATVNQVYAEDPLRHTRGTARLSTEFLRTNRDTWQNLDQLMLPTLVLQGTADSVAPVAVAQKFFSQIPSKTKACYVYAGGYHEIWNDINRMQVMTDLSQWLETGLASINDNAAHYSL